MLKAGFAKYDITPRIGVELAGFGPFICRNSTAIHEQLWARAMALQLDTQSTLIISCDLIGITHKTVSIARKLISTATTLPASSIMVTATHTHSGPNSSDLHGWGEGDLSYTEALPYIIAKAGITAWQNMEPATLFHAESPCPPISFNRELEAKGNLTLNKLQQGTWQPQFPEKVDNSAHVISAYSDNKLLGFFSYYSCHPVICCEKTSLIHGDFCGSATNIIESENKGAIGLFIQGAHGDVNPCFCHQPENESLQALETISQQYAAVIRNGLEQKKALEITTLKTASHKHLFKRRNISLNDLKAMLAESESTFHVNASREQLFGPEARRNTVIALTLRKLIDKAEANRPLADDSELFGLRLGPIELLCSGFEIYQKIKNDIKEEASGKIVLVCSLVNDALGYAVDNATASKGGYACEYAPYILGTIPYANIHEELQQQMLELDKQLYEK